MHRRDRSAGRADSCSRRGAAEAGLQARTLARPSPTRCPSAGRIRSRSPTSSHSASWCRRGASTPECSLPVGRGSLLRGEPASRSDRTALPDASVDPNVAPVRTIADGSTRFLCAPRRDGGPVRRRRSRSAQARRRACQRQDATAALDRRSSRPLPCRVAAWCPLDERSFYHQCPRCSSPTTRRLNPARTPSVSLR